MNRRFTLLLIVVLSTLMMGFIGHYGTNAPGLEPQAAPDLTPQPGAGDENLPPGEDVEGETVVLAPDSPNALVSSAFTYQGQLKSAGTPVNTRCDFIWNLFADIIGGASLATDTDTNVQLTNGLFTVAVNVPASVIDGTGRYVEIQVRCPTATGFYTTLSPRQELQAAPYALGLRLPFSHTINSSTAPVFAITNLGGTGSSPAILGSSVGSNGVNGLSTGGASADNGVYGETNSSATSEAGVKGVSTTSAAGGYFTSSSGYGVYGSANSASDFGGYFTNSTNSTSGGALYANGDAKQSLAGDGFVKAGLYVDCGNVGSLIVRSFNNVNTTPITIINGASAGRCTVDFGFDVSDRYLTVAAFGNGVPRIVTYIHGSTVNRLDLFRYDENGAGVSGGIMILIY